MMTHDHHLRTQQCMLADDGPSVALDLAMRDASDHPFDQAALAWARPRLADRGYPDDSWRDTVWRTATEGASGRKPTR